MDPKSTVKQYRGHLELPNGTLVDVVGDEAGTLREIAQGILQNNCRFEPAPAASIGSGSLLVFHPAFDTGRTPLGWIAPFEVPMHMSSKAVIERRLQAA